MCWCSVLHILLWVFPNGFYPSTLRLSAVMHLLSHGRPFPNLPPVLIIILPPSLLNPFGHVWCLDCVNILDFGCFQLGVSPPKIFPSLHEKLIFVVRFQQRSSSPFPSPPITFVLFLPLKNRCLLKQPKTLKFAPFQSQRPR